jgi:O-antigen ligase
MIYSASAVYKFQKMGQLLTALFAGIAPLLVKDFNYTKFLRTFSYSSVAMGLAYLVIIKIKGFESTEEGLYDFSSAYLVLSYAAGLSSLLVYFGKHNMKQLEKFILTGLGFLLLLMLGARGPLLFFVLSILLVYLYPLMFRKLKLIANLLFFGSFAFVLALFSIPILHQKSDFVQRTTNRLFLLVSDSMGETDISSSVLHRLEGIQFSIESIFSSWKNLFLGEGIGSFGPLFMQLDERQHPHNIFLELWFELGLIGFGIFLLAVFIPYLASKRNSLIKVVPSVALLFILLNYMKSSSYSETRMGLAFLGLYIAIQFVSHSKKNSERLSP